MPAAAAIAGAGGVCHAGETLALTNAPSRELSELHALVEGALRAAQARQTLETTRAQRHRARSRNFIIELAAALREREGGGEVEALHRYSDAARARFGVNELLHDITVCRAAQVPDQPLWYITDPLWQVESELARRHRAALNDFNKLVLGSAHYKLFVGPQESDPDSLLRTLDHAAGRCTGRVFLALIPHPDRWDSQPGDVRTWLFRR